MIIAGCVRLATINARHISAWLGESFNPDIVLVHVFIRSCDKFVNIVRDPLCVINVLNCFVK